MSLRAGVFVCLACLLANPALSASAFAGAWRGGATRYAQNGSAISADRAAIIARKLTEGRILGVTLVSAEDGAVYEVKMLLPDGRIRIVRVDAQSGELR